MICPTCSHVNKPGSDACTNCLTSLVHLDEPALHDRVERSLVTDPVSSLVPRDPVAVGVDAPLADAVRRMIDRRVGAVLVTAPDGGLVGILTERDFLTRVAGRPGFPALPVREFMTPDPETVALSDSLAYALGKMDAGGYRHLPVVKGGVPVGVVSVRDILRRVTQVCQNG